MNLTRIGAVRRLNRVAERHAQGRLSAPEKLRGALAEVDRVAATLEGLERNSLHLQDLACAYQLAGNLLYELGRYDETIDRLEAAEELFLEAGGAGIDYAKFLHDFAVTLMDLEMRSSAITHAERSVEAFVAAGATHEARRAANFHARLVAQYGDGDGPDIEALRAAVRTETGWEQAKAAQALALALLDDENCQAHADEIHGCVQMAAKGSRSTGPERLDHIATALTLGIELHWRGLPIPAWLAADAQETMRAARGAGRLDIEGSLLAVQALYCLDAGDRPAAINAALDGVARHDELALSTQTSLVRMLTSHVADYTRQAALDAATDDNDALLAAELLESARLQVEPVVSPHTAPTHGRVRSEVGALHAVSVAGSSRLQSRYGARPPTIALEEMIATTGGEDAHWWGAWSANERIYWALRLYGHWSTGKVVVAPRSRISTLVGQAFEQSTLPKRYDPVSVLRGPWCRTADDEEAFATELGGHVIPPALQLALEDARRRDDPLSLVLSGNLFSFLPVPLLAVEGDDGITRIIEGAVLRVAAPAILTRRAARVRPPDVDLFPIVAACVDPRANLQFSQEIPTGARVVLGNAKAAEAHPATRANVTAALPEKPGAAGIFYYSGHAVARGLGADSEDALALGADETLSAGWLLDQAQAGRGPAFPSRVMLSACASSGASGSGAGEWLGLTAAALWNGARQVVATNWPIWDTPFTAAFDQAVVGRLRRSDDVAASLRLSQLEALQAWRQSGHDFSDYDGQGLNLEQFSTPFPLIWAAYSCVGLRR